MSDNNAFGLAAACCICCSVIVCVILTVVLVGLTVAGDINRSRAVQPTCASGDFLTVTTLADAGDGSFRDALDRANTKPGVQCIRFNVPGIDGNPVVYLASRLPDISDTVDIDGLNFGLKVCLEGSASDIDCAADTAIPPFGPPAQPPNDIPFLQFGDRTAATDNVAAGSIVRNLIFRNGGQSKNTVLPLAGHRGPCVGVSIKFTSNVTVAACEFKGFTLGNAAIDISVGQHHHIIGNRCDDTTDCVEAFAMHLSNVSSNVAINGFPGFLETERVNDWSVAFAFIDCSFNYIETNYAHGYDTHFMFVQYARNNVVRFNRGAHSRIADIVVAVAATNNAFIGNVFSYGLAHVSFPIAGPHSVDNPVICNSLIAAAAQAIDNGGVIIGSNGGVEFVITPNDALDADTGPQDLQNYPVIDPTSHVDVTVDVADIFGTLHSTPGAFFLVECFLNFQSNRNAHHRIAYDIVQTDANGTACFTCRCGDTGQPTCLTNLRRLTAECEPGHAVYATATATECPVVDAVCEDPHDHIDLIEPHTIDAGQSPLIDAMVARHETSISVARAFATASAAAKQETRWPFCEGGVVLCLESKSLAVCNATKAKKTAHIQAATFNATCPPNETLLCLGSTSEVSYAVRVTTDGEHSSAGARGVVAVAVAMACLYAALK